MGDQISTEYITDLLRQKEQDLRHSDRIQKMLALHEAETTVIALALVCTLSHLNITVLTGTYCEDDQAISWSARYQSDDERASQPLEDHKDDLTAKLIDRLNSVAHRINVESPFALRTVFQPKNFKVNVRENLTTIEMLDSQRARPALAGEVLIDMHTGVLRYFKIDVIRTLAAI